MQGWRAKLADQVADPVSTRTPLSPEQVRAAIGALFAALSVMYLVKTAKAASEELRG